MSSSTPRKTRLSALALSALAVAATVGGAVAGPAHATSPTGPSASAHAVGAPLDARALREAITIRPGDQAAGALARVHSSGHEWSGASGDVHTGKRISDKAHFRIGSISKTFEAVVLLQLSAEGRVDLDGTVQHYLPGLLPDTFQPVTVRQLLNHTSGLPSDFEGAPAPTGDEQIANRFDYLTFDQVIQGTLRPEGRAWPGPHFAPGTKQEYNSFGYRVAGKLIEHLTGHSLKREITDRVLTPLRMRHTSVPTGNGTVPRPYLPGYLPTSKGELVDINEQGGNPSQMISTTADLDRFMTSLFTGRLLRPAQTAELRALPRDADGKLLPYANGSNCNIGRDKGSACFSVALMSFPLPDGTLLWGKTGHDPGYASGVFASPDLSRRAVYAVGTDSFGGGGAPRISGRLAAAAFGSNG
ncbi:serine hydrolase domain-containing protein [Streptomyces syringium]|uniref:serine hydrolase domain-containing protein n=1 Tax=Streptomyces syringium TaxID=76729 RepID=UPI0034425093